MPRNKNFLIFTVFALMLSGSAVAKDIYKWTDEEGNVHYRDRPTGAPSEVRLGISYKGTDKTIVEQQQKAQLDSQTARQERRNARDEADRAAAAEAAAAAERQKQCDSYRASLERYAQSRRLYREGENGERTYLDDDEMMQARKRLEDHIAENCSS